MLMLSTWIIILCDTYNGNSRWEGNWWGGKQKPEAKLVWECFHGTMYHETVPTLVVEAKWEHDQNILWNYVSYTGWRMAWAAYATHSNIITMVKPWSSKVRRDTKDVFMKACNNSYLASIIDLMCSPLWMQLSITTMEWGWGKSFICVRRP